MSSDGDFSVLKAKVHELCSTGALMLFRKNFAFLLNYEDLNMGFSNHVPLSLLKECHSKISVYLFHRSCSDSLVGHETPST